MSVLPGVLAQSFEVFRCLDLFSPNLSLLFLAPNGAKAQQAASSWCHQRMAARAGGYKLGWFCGVKGIFLHNQHQGVLMQFLCEEQNHKYKGLAREPWFVPTGPGQLSFKLWINSWQFNSQNQVGGGTLWSIMQGFSFDSYTENI